MKSLSFILAIKYKISIIIFICILIFWRGSNSSYFYKKVYKRLELFYIKIKSLRKFVRSFRSNNSMWVKYFMFIKTTCIRSTFSKIYFPIIWISCTSLCSFTLFDYRTIRSIAITTIITRSTPFWLIGFGYSSIKCLRLSKSSRHSPY